MMLWNSNLEGSSDTCGGSVLVGIHICHVFLNFKDQTLQLMLNVQKSSLDKTGLGYVESELSSMVTPTKFVSPVSIPKPKVRVHKEEA